MPAGQQPTVDLLNNQLTACALTMRDLMQKASDLNLQIGKLGSAGVVALGTDQATADDIVAKAAVLNTVAAVYYGTATQATEYDFNDALATLRAGQ